MVDRAGPEKNITKLTTENARSGTICNSNINQKKR